VSWRVLILPYIQQETLFKEFKLDEPWDSDQNKKLIAKMPAILRGPNKKLNEEGEDGLSRAARNEHTFSARWKKAPVRTSLRWFVEHNHVRRNQ